MQRTLNSIRSVVPRNRVCAFALVAAALLAVGPSVARAQNTLVPPPTTVQAAAPTTNTRTGVSDLRPRPLGPSAGAVGPKRTVLPTPDVPAASTSSTGTLVQTLASLGVVLGLIFALGAGLRRIMRSRGRLAGALGAMGAAPSPAGILEILGRYPLSRGTSLVLLKVDRRVLLLAQGSAGLRVRGGVPLPTMLCEFTDPDEVASIMIKTNEAEGRSIGATFRQALAGFERQHDGVIEEPRPSLLGRFIRRGSGGDRTELLDESALGGGGDPLRLKDFERRTADPVGSLRSRLTALRGGGAQ